MVNDLYDQCDGCGAEFVKLRVSFDYRVPRSYSGFTCGYCGGKVKVNPNTLGGEVGDWTWKQMQVQTQADRIAAATKRKK